MIVNRTTVSKKDLEFVSKHRCKEPRIAFAILVVALCGAFNLIFGGISLYNAVFSGGSVDVVTVTISFVLGVLFILWSVFFNKLSALRSLRLPSVKAPRIYEFMDEFVLCRLSLNGIESEERYAYSIMDKYFEQNNAIYIRSTIDNRKRFLVVHNDSYSGGSSEELSALLESHGVHK